MRTFLIRSILFFFFAVLTSVLVFFWLHNPAVLPAISEQATSFVVGDSRTDAPNETTEAEAGIQPLNIPKEDIKLSSLTLQDSQRKALETAGINVESFVITKAMIECGVEKLGERRASEIFAGDTPSLIETGKLVPCLTQ
jgi:hypothetical protein